jgi:hypothetical protein
MRRRERLFLLSLIIGLALGLIASWVLWPRQSRAVELSQVRSSYQNDFIVMVSLAYQQEGDLEAARQRLRLLDDADVAQRVADLAEQRIRAGADPATRRGLARLAHALGARQAMLMAYVATPRRTATLTETPQPTVTPVPMTPTATLPSPSPTATSLVVVRSDAPTPTRPAKAAYVVVKNALVSERADVPPGQVAVHVQNVVGQGLAGVRLRVRWPEGVDEFVTGLHPDKSLGYADYSLTPGLTYTISVLDGRSESARGIQLPTDTLTASWRIVFEYHRSRDKAPNRR